MNTFQLRCFLTVANTLNFARAAEQVQISQPAITHQIKSLEDELNVKLFRRTTRVVELTPEGEAFIADARSMIAIEEQAKLRFGHPNDGAVEPLSIGCGSYIQLGLLAETLRALLANRPALHPRLFAVPHDRLFHLLETGSADVILDVREGSGAKGDFAFQELRRSALVCACRADHPWAGRGSAAVGDLASQKLIFCDPVNLSPDIAKLQWRLLEGRSPADAHFCDSSDSAIVLARAGFGLAILPELFVPGAEDLAKVEIAEAPKLSFGMFYRPSSESAALARFLREARRQFSQDAGRRGESA